MLRSWFVLPEGPMTLTFKKAFGFDFMPADAAFWLMELGQNAYSFAVRATPVAISVGRFGRTRDEQRAIDGSMTSGNRPFGVLDGCWRHSAGALNPNTERFRQRGAGHQVVGRVFQPAVGGDYFCEISQSLHTPPDNSGLSCSYAHIAFVSRSRKAARELPSLEVIAQGASHPPLSPSTAPSRELPCSDRP